MWREFLRHNFLEKYNQGRISLLILKNYEYNFSEYLSEKKLKLFRFISIKLILLDPLFVFFSVNKIT